MITFSFLKQKRYRVLILISTFGAVMFLASFLDGTYESYTPKAGERLGLKKELNFPISEISGLYLRPANDKAQREVLTIGDDSASLGIGMLVGDEIIQKDIIDFSEAITRRFGICQSSKIPGCKKFLRDITSQWEAVSSDASGRIFLLHEQLASIFVYDISANNIVSIINLDSFEVEPDKQRRKVTIDQENALGEGFVLLKNGHMLVIKERYKPTIVEFGLPGETPEGYRPDLWVGGEHEFPLTGERMTMVPLKVWKVEKKYRQCDLSELSSDDNGELYLLSQQCQWIAKLGNFSLEAHEVVFSKFWTIPNKLKNAEAMIIVDEDTFVVAEDKKSIHKKNMFVLIREAKAD